MVYVVVITACSVVCHLVCCREKVKWCSGFELINLSEDCYRFGWRIGDSMACREVVPRTQAEQLQKKKDQVETEMALSLFLVAFFLVLIHVISHFFF